MSDVLQTLLPSTATDLAKAMDILEERLLHLPVASITKNPFLVSPDVLDHLAWEMSVDVWGDDIPIETRRRMVAASPEVHRFKGTPHGLRTALEAVGFELEIIEWWQAVPMAERGTFQVAIGLESGTGLTGDYINARGRLALRIVRRNSPVSRGFEIRMRLHRSATRSQTIAHAMHTGAHSTIGIHFDPQVAPARITRGTVLHRAAYTTIGPAQPRFDVDVTQRFAGTALHRATHTTIGALHG